MTRITNPGIILLGIWLVAQGLVSLIGITFQGRDVILALLALAAGVLLLIGSRRWRSSAPRGRAPCPASSPGSADHALPREPLKHCIALALTYHMRNSGRST